MKHLNEQEGMVARDRVLGGVWVLLWVGFLGGRVEGEEGENTCYSHLKFFCAFWRTCLWFLFDQKKETGLSFLLHSVGLWHLSKGAPICSLFLKL